MQQYPSYQQQQYPSSQQQYLPSQPMQQYPQPQPMQQYQSSQPIQSQPIKPKDSNKLEWWEKVSIGIGICVILALIVMKYSSSPTVSVLIEKKDTGTRTGASTGAGTVTAPLNIRFAVQSGQNWDIGTSGQYKCPSAKGVDVSSDNGNFANYCIFTGTDGKKNAEAYCKTDPNCLGYVTDGKGKYQLTYRGVVSDSTKPSNNFYLKQIGKNNYKLQDGKQWDASKPNDYTCPKAKGVDTRGNWGSYCIFLGENAPENAMTQCESDSKCTGYFIGSYEGAPMYQLTSKGGTTVTDATKSPPNNYFAVDYVSEYGL